MEVQLPLPGVWLRKMSNRDPVAALEEIERDKFAATAARSSFCLTVSPTSTASGTRSVAQAVAGYVDDMLGDVFFELEEELERERDDASPLD